MPTIKLFPATHDMNLLFVDRNTADLPVTLDVRVARAAAASSCEPMWPTKMTEITKTADFSIIVKVTGHPSFSCAHASRFILAAKEVAAGGCCSNAVWHIFRRGKDARASQTRAVD